MKMKFSNKSAIWIMALLIAAVVLVACQPGTGGAATATTEPTTAATTAATTAPTTEATQAGSTGGDLLADIQSRGTLVVSTDPAYPPQSELVENATRDANTKCTTDQLT